MTLRFYESFNSINSAGLTQRWTSGSGIIQGGTVRTGSLALQDPVNLSKTYNDQQTWIAGIAFRMPAIGAANIINILDSGTSQDLLRITALGFLQIVQGGGGILATGTHPLSANVWYYLEFKVIVANAGGTAEVRLNGAVEATFTGDTQNTANATANQIGLPSNVLSTFYADHYLCDGQGVINNDYLGDTQVQCILPSGVGFYTAFTTVFGAATHWQAVNEVPPDDDTSYVESDTINQRDTYAFGNLTPTSATIPGIQISLRARKTQAGGLNIARMYRSSGGVDDQGADIALSTSYASYLEAVELNPDGGGAWNVAAVNGAEFGARSR